MATNILMPALSPTMTEGTLARWLKREGENVRAGDVIAEIETDKATMEVEAVDEGVLGRILVPDGTAGVKVNAPIAVLVGDGESADAPPQPNVVAPPNADVATTEKSPVAADARQSSCAPQPNPTAAKPNGTRVFASPLARRIAGRNGIDLHTLTGTGPGGRIVRADVEAAGSVAASGSAPVAQSQSRPASTAITVPHTLQPNSTMRKTIARRLSESKQFVPHFYLSADVELDALLKLRAELNARSPKDGTGAFKLSVNDMVIKAAAIALRRVPGVNASYTDESVVLYHDVDISMAVAIPDGLITPIIRGADRKALPAISNEAKELATRARAGKLKPEEFQGGSFSISNLGMFGVRDFAAIINPPQGGILAVGAGEQRAVVQNGTLAVATVMTCTLSVDHRVIDGALGAQWLQVFKSVVEDPLSMLI